MKEIITGVAVGGVALVGQLAQAVPVDPSGWTGFLKEGGALLCTVLAIIYLLKEKSSMKADHKAELEKKDAKIAALESKIEDLEGKTERQAAKIENLEALLSRHILQLDKQIDVSATIKRAALELEEEHNG